MRSHDSAIPPRLGGKLSVNQSGRARSRVTEAALVGVVVVEVAHVVVGVVVAVPGAPERRGAVARDQAGARAGGPPGRACPGPELLRDRTRSAGARSLPGGGAPPRPPPPLAP